MNTNETKHTPGPWKVVELKKGEPVNINGVIHSTVRGKGEIRILSADGEQIATAIRYRYDRNPRQANAALIAAAPELLEAIEMFTACRYEDKSGICSALMFAHAAIAKAKGGAQ